MTDQSYQFPAGFRFGTATAAYQIEGAHDVDGKGPSVWDKYCATPGNIHTGDTGDDACDFYHRYEEDIRLMAELGIKHYRMSLSWPRILPHGSGKANPLGLDFYDRVIDRLLGHGITPTVTLFHWDTPQALEDAYGSWASRRIVDDFAAYAALAAARYGDRVTNWLTLNEVAAFTEWGFWHGHQKSPHINAPGTKLDSAAAVGATTLHAMLAHGAGVRAIRASSPRPCKISFAHNEGAIVPVTESPADIEAAKKAYAQMCGPLKIWAALKGALPEGWLDAHVRAGNLPEITDEDLKAIAQPIDALAFNVYTGPYVRAAGNPAGYELVPYPADYPNIGGLEWLYFVPEALYWQARLTRDVLGWNGEIYFSENGCCANELFSQSGEILDVDRILYLRQALKSVHRLVAEEFDVTGYFQWSFLDNFEWLWGYSKRFGLVRVDYATQKRTPKLSASWYAEVIRQGRVV